MWKAFKFSGGIPTLNSTVNRPDPAISKRGYILNPLLSRTNCDLPRPKLTLRDNSIAIILTY